ncbi:MAG: flavodoxin domain-containing protein [Clostridiaceae bacterium]|nr:flavodoxin domain-containing protein [Clostridiaceae bacterium]
MVIVYESKTGFTKKYADMLAEKTGLKAFPVKEIPKINMYEEIIFLGWMKVGKIQGLDKVRKYNVKAVCGSGTARIAEPSTKEVIARNNIKDLPFFYLQGGCLPLKQLKGIDKILLSMFVKILKNRKDKDEKTVEAIFNIENGFDGVKEENLGPVFEWLKSVER